MSGAGEKSARRGWVKELTETVLWEFFHRLFSYAGLGPPELLNWQDVTLKRVKGTFLTVPDPPSSSLHNVSADCRPQTRFPGETSSDHLSAVHLNHLTVKLYVHASDSALPSGFHEVLDTCATLPVMVSASLQADTRSTYSSSSQLNTSSGLWSQAGWFQECFGGGAEERAHAGDVFGSSLALINYHFKTRRAMDTTWTWPCTNGNKPRKTAKAGRYLGQAEPQVRS